MSSSTRKVWRTTYKSIRYKIFHLNVHKRSTFQAEVFFPRLAFYPFFAFEERSAPLIVGKGIGTFPNGRCALRGRNRTYNLGTVKIPSLSPLLIPFQSHEARINRFDDFLCCMLRGSYFNKPLADLSFTPRLRGCCSRMCEGWMERAGEHLNSESFCALFFFFWKLNVYKRGHSYFVVLVGISLLKEEILSSP